MSDQRYIKEGWLMKRSRSGRVVSNWRRRYFRLTRTELLYYKTPQDTAPRRCYELTLDTSVLRTNDQGYPLCILFQPAPGQPSFYMQAENEVEKDEWITAIYNAYRRTPDVAQQTLAPEMPKEESAPSIGPTPPQPPAAPAPPSRILLKLVVEEARKLKAADFNGKSDPYCVVKLVGKDGQVIDVEEKRTEVIPATLEPAWRKPFEIGRVVDLNSVKAIRFDLFDHDTFKRHDSLGSVQVPFSRFRMSPASTAQSEPIDDWFRVEPPKKTGLSSSPRRNDTREKEHVVKDWGELRVQMSISGPNLVDFFHSSDLAFVPTSPVATASNEHTDNRLEVTVIAARDLISADLNNSSDPYCELSLLDDHGKPIPGEYATTAIMHRTRNPAWADEHHVFGLICHIEKAASLKVRVVDYDKSNRNDPLGFVHIGLDQLSAHKWTEWHVLQPEEGMSVRENLGAIQLKIWLIGERRGEHVRQLKIEKELNTKRHNISVEQLELENAQFQLHDAACKLDGARIPCAVTDYQARDPRFYGINGCIHYLNSQIPRAHQEKVSSDEGFQARAGLEGQAVLEVTVIEASDLKQKQKQGGDTGTTATPYAVIEIDPSVCVEGCKRTSAPLSPQKSKRIAAAASEARNTMFSKRSQAEVSLHRSKLVKNEMRSEKSLEVNPDKPVLKVEILTGHGLSPADMNGYSDPYCTLSITDQTGKAIDAEKKRTAVVSKTLNPVWTNENFLFGNSVPLSDAKSLLIHVKDHNNIGRSTPLGRVEIPLYDLCRASAGFTSISSKTVMKRYELKPEPWMKKHAKDLGELCIKTDVVGDATALAELMQRVSTVPMEKSLSILTFSEANIQSEVSMDMDMSATDIGGSELEDETTEVIQRGLPIQTSTSRVLGTTATWRKEKFALSLSYPGVFSDAKYPSSETHVLHLRVHEARNLLLTETAGSANIGSSSLELDGVHDSQTNGMSRNAERAQDATNVYFTIIPVLGDGRLEDAERKQSLTVYNTRDPSWPEENFVFGKIKDIANVSYLSLHLYGRDLQNDQKEVLAKLLNHDEKKQDARLKRFQLHKLTPSGEVDDDGFEILQYGQRILAFRGGDNGGRFYPARVQKYIPFPDDVYDVHFEDEVDTIDELRNLISFDVKGAVQAVRSDGRVDVSVENELPAIANSARRTLRYTVKPTQLIPINSLTDKVEMVMARRFDMEKEEDERWLKLQHKFSGIVIDVLSASDLLVPVNEAGKPQKFKQLDKTSKPTCRITMLGNPKQVASSTCRFNKQGELIPGDTVTLSNWNCQKGEVLAATVLHGSAETDDVHLFQQKPLVMGRVDATPPGDTDYQPVEPHEIKMGYQILEQASSILIRVDNEDAAGNQTVGFVKVDLAMLQSGQQDLTLQIVPPDTTNVPYYKFVGSLFLRITTWSDTFKPRQMQASTKAGDFKPRLSVCGLSMWYQRQVKIEAQSSSILTRGVTWIERRQILRSSLTPTENCQIDEFHAVLVVIMKRIVSILREIRQFEEFEVLSADDMRKCRQVHTVNADPTSEWLGCTMDKLSLEARKEVVAGLENELLDLAGVTGPRIFPDADIPREEWVKLRADRQRLLRESGSFFMRDQTSALVLSVPRSFTGEGMISWILRHPPVLWEDGWTKYCRGSALESSCRLGWRNANLEFDPDAIQAPTTREYTLQWLSALCAAGFVENVTPGIAAVTDLGKRQVLLEYKVDRFYRLREVDMWMEKLSREKSLFPIDLVQEIDCYQASDLPVLRSVDENAGNSSSEQEQITNKRSKTYAKKLTEHCDGFLGMHTLASSTLFSPDIRKNSFLQPVAETIAEKAEEYAENVLWDWKYCLFVPSRKHLYMYEQETSTTPVAFIDMASAACKVAYNFTNDAKGGWMDIVNPTVCVRKPDSQDFVSISAENLDKMARTRDKGDKVIEVKTPHTQKWIQALTSSGVCVDMRPGQMVLMKRLNPTILQQKCIKHATEFDHNDLEGSFNRLLNCVFGHDRELSHQDHEKKSRELRAQVRRELKKPGCVGETVMAYYGKGKNLKSKPMQSGNFKRDSLYSGRIVRIRTPFTDPTYQFTAKYDISNKMEVPESLSSLLAKYKVTDKASWLSLPKAQRDMFLLYDVEYSHNNERIVEEGLMRELIRTSEGDLDPHKVSDKCTDLNILFKATDLENCVSRMVKHRYRHKPLGVLKIPIRMISPHRTVDAWYPLAPASDMLQKTRLGQIRVELKLVHKRDIKRSAKVPSLIEAIISEVSPPPPQEKNLTPKGNAERDPKKKIPFVVGLEPSFVKVSILEGRSLRVADLFTSDPFVEMVLIDDDSKERDTSLKTDIKMKTLNPKWENQEFLLGKTEKTMLRDKKALLLRVMDFDQTSANDPLGCVTIEFQRSETGYIRGVVLKQADALGGTIMQELTLDEYGRVEVEAMLLPATGQSKPKAKKTPAPDGLLGKLRFSVDIMRNENYVDPNAKQLDTTYSAEVAIKDVDLKDENWDEYTCYFQPHGEGGLRIQYDPASEDLGVGNPYKFSELLRQAAPLLSSDTAKIGKSLQANSFSVGGAYNILGRTYDLSKVDYFDVRLVSESQGRVYEGQLGKLDRKMERKSGGKAEGSKSKFSLKNPEQCANFRDEKLVLTDRDSKQKATLTFDLNLIGILRADRVRRILADTFRLVGLVFDSRTLNQNSGRYEPEQLQKDVHTFLWDTCRTNVFPGRNIGDELLAQVRIMRHASKLHWKVTPQLLAYVFEVVFVSGEKDRLSYENAVAVDAVLNRWSRVLTQVTEAKDYLTGHLHGKKTPRLIEALFTECEWTGFDVLSLRGGLTSSNGDSVGAGRNSEERSSPLHVGDRVTAQLPLFKHAGVPVDVELPGGQFIAAIIAKEWGGGRYDIKLCTGFGMEETVFVCPLHDEKDPEVSNRRVRDIKQGRLAKLKHFDEKEHPESPYLVEYLDHLQPHEEWQPRDSIEATLSQVEGGVLKGQLQKEDYVRVNGGAVVSPEESRDRRHSTLGLAKIDDGVANPTPQKTSTKTGSTRPARVSHNYGNARYDIVYLDGQQPKDEKLVTRERLLPVTDGIMYDGRVSSVYHPTSRIDDSPSTAKYSTLLESGELVDNLERSQLRTRQKFIAADTALLGSVFSSSLQTLDKTGTQPSSSTTTMADKLNNLWWGSDKIVKVYAMLPSAVKTIQARDATTNKLLQSALVERSEDQPRFLGQYHGFVKGDNFDKAEEEKLELVYTAACKRRMHNTLSNGTLPFSKKNCFYLILAPPPLVQVRGAVTVSSCSDSGPLFKALVLATLGKTPGSAVFILQRLLRAECNIDPQLHRKGRTVMIEAVKVDFNNTPSRSVVVNMMPSPSDNTSVGDNNADLTGVALSNATIEIKFRLSMPHNDHGNISDAVNVSFAQATGISGRLKLKKTLAVEGDKPLTDFGDLGKLPWLLAASEEMIAPSMALSVDFTSAEGRFDSEPEVSLELEPLDDIRVSVRDFDENVHELHFPMYDVLAEARVRRELSPFHKAYIAPGPFATSHCNLQFQKTSANKSPNTAAVKVPRADIKFDKLSVQVLEASNMTLKEKMGTDGLLVEVLLVSSDFRQHMANDKKVTTPFGLALSSTGEILPDADKQIYPKNSVFSLTNDKTAAGTTLSTPLTTSVAWKNKYALQPDSQLKFTYPAIDLDRVSDVKMIVRDKKTNTKIGIVTIPMAKIGVSRSTNNADKPKDEPIFSVHHEGSDRKRVVGTISLSITRMKSYGEKTEVYAKQLEKSMDFWAICPKELLKMTLEQHENKLSRSFLATGPPVSGGGKILLEKSLEMELQLQKITKVRLIFDAMNKLHATTLAGSSTAVVSTPNASNRISTDLTSLAFDQLRLTLQQTKSLVKDTAQELGLIDRRLPWSSDAHGDENDSQLRDNMVIVEANVATCTHRVRHAVLKLYEVFIVHFMPKLNELYILDAKEDRVDVATGEKLLSFFNNEVDELELEDQKVRQRLYQRLRLAKLTQVLDMIMRATVRVKVMDEDRNNVDNYLGTACIPLMDLLDQQPRDDMYQLLYLPTTNLRGYRIATHSPGEKDRGKVRLRLHLKISESSFFEQAINVYKIWKAKYLAQHEAARRRLHAAVVPAQRRRWLTIKGYLDELTKQAQGKLHWERTPVLLSLVWDIFALQESSPTHVKKKAIDAEELEYTQSVAQVANAYRDSVMKVHKRWVNMQPRLEELMTIQAAALIHAQRTPELLDDIEREIEGLDVGLSTAWQQVKQKWQILLNALEELVSMQERKLNLTRAPQLLKIVEQRCSKGLSTRHADAVSNIQSRWMAITQPNGPLSELRLMEKKGLHWRRTHELLLLLDEQCEGFADVDARALNTVQNRWEQVQEWLHEIVEMQQQHSIDCEHTPFILEKMHLWRSMRANRQGELNKPEKLFNPIRAAPPSPKNKDEAGGRPRSLSHQNSSSRVSSDGSIRSDSGAEDNGQLEGMAEWYAIEEAKYELERIPYHRITVDTEKRNWLSYSRDGKDIRLLITQQEMVFTPANVRLALEDRGVIPKTSNFDPTADRNAKGNDSDDAWVSPSLADPKSGSQSVALPKTVLKEIEELEKMLEKHRDDSQQVFALPNPERVAELYQSMKSLGKSDLLWKVDHAVSRNRELAVPENYQLLLKEMTLRQIPTTEVENLVKSLAFTLQKEVLVAKGIAVPTTANPTTLLQLMHRHQVKEVLLPPDTTAIQTLLQERGMDRKGDPVILRGIRIGTQSTGAASDNTSGASSSKALNTGLGIIDTQIEILRKTLLFEALRKRNSLVRTFAGESHVLDDEDERTEADMFAAAVENAEVDVSGDYMTLVERFQRLLVHEAYTKRLAEYAALDRCVRALLGKSRDETVTKEEIAMELHNINKRVIGANYRLPAEAFTKEELKQAVGAGRIRTPSDEMLARCPQGDNAHAMAHYAAISYAANVFQEVTSFRSRVDLGKNRLQDTFPFDECSSVDGVAIPKQWSRWTFSQSIADWLLGFDTSTLSIKRKLSAAHRQRLEWASAAFTLRNRWLQRGLGWCDPAFGEGVGVKILLDRLLLFEAANKMDMVKTEKLLREVRDKCSRLREREQEAQAKLEERYQSNLELLEKLVTHAERCMNNRKLHSEETPVLLHKLEQVCVVPNGLNERHREAYHKVATHWLPQQQHLTELVKMHREGTFSITRTPELLGKMNYHTEGKAGSEELSEDMVAASAQRVAPELQATFVDRKLNEVRLGQRKEASSLRLDLNTGDDIANQSVDDTTWKELSHSKRVAQPLSPHEKHTNWKVVRNAVAANAAFSASSGDKAEKFKVSIEPKRATQLVSPRRKLSLSEELKELLRSPSQWLTGAGPQEESIKPELYFPKEVVLETPSASLTGAAK
ncbi:Synaptotagmin-3 [Phytophthora ramorum]|uniref:Synaptotagmin-3 n=1 Tax=Phytophthora ramorum TaxID=164328 RepID=UPI0030B1C68E|nr:Synaptotagmin-3 [Phytophthora ramorum]